jgi:hypothetical protein
MTNDSSDKLMRRRRWMRFGLRTLFFIMFLLCVALGWFAWMWERAREQRRTISAIEAAGGSVRFAGEDTWVQRNLTADTVVRVDLSSTEFCDLTPLAELKGLWELDLDHTPVSDLKPLANLEVLAVLDLSGTLVNDLSPLVGAKRLEALYLCNTQVNDLSPLAGSERLEILWIIDTPVTDISPLTGLKRLDSLKLVNTQVCEDDVNRLRRALPNCKILYSLGTSEPGTETPGLTPR